MGFFTPKANASKIEIGIAYFIKNGNIEVKKVIVDLQYFEKIKLQIFEGTYFDSYIKKGYSIIFHYASSEKWNQLSVDYLNQLWSFLSPNLTSKDGNHILQQIQQVENSSKILSYKIKNFWPNFDYDYTNSTFQRERCSEIAHYFIREKLNQLTPEEQIMFQKYRVFNLQEILLGDYLHRYPINHNNAGIIYISKNQTICSTLKKKQHGKEMDSVLVKLYPDCNIDYSNVFEVVRNFEDIVIQLLDQELCIWLPENISPYQKEKLNQLLEQLKPINEKCFLENQSNLNIAFGIVHSNPSVQAINDVEEYQGLDNFEDFLQNGIEYVRNNKSNKPSKIA